MTPLERFASLLETKKTIMESAMNEKKWVQDVDTKWKPPEGLFTKSAKEIAEVLAKASPDYATAVRRAVFYYNRGGFCNKGGPRFNKEECRKACRVLKLLRKLFKVSEKDRSRSEIDYCEAVSESVETDGDTDLLALAEAVIEYATDYGHDVVTPTDVSPDALADYESVLTSLLGPGLSRDDGLSAKVQATQFGVQVLFEYPSGYLYFPGEFEFPDGVDADGVSLSYNVTDLSYLDSSPDRPTEEKRALLEAILAAIEPLDIEEEEGA